MVDKHASAYLGARMDLYSRQEFCKLGDGAGGKFQLVPVKKGCKLVHDDRVESRIKQEHLRAPARGGVSFADRVDIVADLCDLTPDSFAKR